MAKQSNERDRQERARRRLDKAQAELRRAQDRRAQVVAQGERDVERARQRAGRRLAKLTQRVEKRSSAVARAEERLQALVTAAQAQRDAGSQAGRTLPASPTGVANRLAEAESDSPLSGTPDGDAVVPSSAEALLRSATSQPEDETGNPL